MPRTNLFFRNDTMFGVCQAIGEDFGFHPNYLRLILAGAFYFAPLGVTATYLALGVLVAARHAGCCPTISAPRCRRWRPPRPSSKPPANPPPNPSASPPDQTLSRIGRGDLCPKLARFLTCLTKR